MIKHMSRVFTAAVYAGACAYYAWWFYNNSTLAQRASDYVRDEFTTWAQYQLAVQRTLQSIRGLPETEDKGGA